MSRNKIAIGLLILTVFAVYLAKSRQSRPLPTGDMSQDLAISPSLLVTPAVIATHPEVEIATTKGKFTIQLRPDISPRSTVNFLTKWSNGYCDKLTFHRVEDWVVQGCDPAENGTGGQLTLPTETSSVTFVRGSIGVARLAYPKDKSNDSQFFIVKNRSIPAAKPTPIIGFFVSGRNSS